MALRRETIKSYNKATRNCRTTILASRFAGRATIGYPVKACSRASIDGRRGMTMGMITARDDGRRATTDARRRARTRRRTRTTRVCATRRSGTDDDDDDARDPQLNIANPQTGAQKKIEIVDENKLRCFYDKRISAEVEGDELGDVRVRALRCDATR